MKLPIKVPKKFHPYFWDVDVKKLNPSQKPYFVIQRLLDWNNFGAARWVINNFPQELIVQSLKKLRGWSRKSAVFWGKYFNIPQEELICNRKGFPNPPIQPWNH